MIANEEEARTEMVNLFKEAWEANPPSDSVPVEYPDRTFNPPTARGASYARWKCTHLDKERKATGGSGQGLHTYTGSIDIRIHTWAGKGSDLRYALARIAREAYDDITSENGIWFRNVEIQEGGTKDQWTITAVRAIFEYDLVVTT